MISSGCWTAQGKTWSSQTNSVRLVIFIGPESDHCLPLSVTDWLTHSLPFSKLDWCDPRVWRCLLKTCWGCHWCWCWWSGSCWQQFDADLEAEVWSEVNVLFRLWLQGLVKILKLKFRRDFEVEVWPVFCCWCLVTVTKLNTWSRFWS